MDPTGPGCGGRWARSCDPVFPAPAARLATALERLAVEAGIDAPRELQRRDVEDATWFVLGTDAEEDPQKLIVAVGRWSENGPDRDGEYVALDRVGAGLEVGAWGDCNPTPVLPPGASWVEIQAGPNGLDPAASSLSLEVNERECTSARNPEPFLREPVVIEEEDSVTVYWTSDSPTGGQNCPGNPSVSRVIHLEEPLGERAVLDGSSWPARALADRQLRALTLRDHAKP